MANELELEMFNHESKRKSYSTETETDVTKTEVDVAEKESNSTETNTNPTEDVDHPTENRKEKKTQIEKDNTLLNVLGVIVVAGFSLIIVSIASVLVGGFVNINHKFIMLFEIAFLIGTTACATAHYYFEKISKRISYLKEQQEEMRINSQIEKLKKDTFTEIKIFKVNDAYFDSFLGNATKIEAKIHEDNELIICVKAHFTDDNGHVFCKTIPFDIEYVKMSIAEVVE